MSSANLTKIMTNFYTTLTPREIQVLQLAAGGASNSDIAQALDIAKSTVKNHISSINKKYGTETRVQAIIYGLTTGDVDFTIARNEVEGRRVKSL